LNNLRIAVLFSVSSILFSSCNLIHTYRDIKKTVKADITNASAKEQHIPFRLVGNKVVLSVTLSGKQTQKADFILDTGAPTLLSEKFAKTRNYPLEKTAARSKTNTALGKVSNNRYFTRGLSFELGNIRVYKEHTLVVGIDNEFVRCNDVAGIIGVDILAKFNLLIDFSKQEIVLYDKNAPTEAVAGAPYVIPFGNFSLQKTPEASFTLNGEALDFIWDVGYNGGILVQYKSKEKLEQFIRKHPESKEVESFADMAGIGGVVAARKTNYYLETDTIVAEKKKIPVGRFYTTYTYNEKLPDVTHCNVGVSFMKQYKMLISWSDKKIYLVPVALDSTRTSKLPGVSAAYNAKDQTVSIRLVNKSGVAYKEGLRGGDVLESIDGISVNKLIDGVNDCKINEVIMPALTKAEKVGVFVDGKVKTVLLK
jgi:hypothetical protein